MKHWLLNILLFLGVFTAFSQTSLSFYNLGDATFQNSHMNPAYIPTDKVMVGLPVISGVHLNFNNKLSYDQIITKTSEGTQEIDVSKALSKLQPKNMLSFNSNISLFHLAIATKTKGAISFFANERVEADFLYSEPFMRMVANGNGSTLGEEISLSDTRAAVTYFREIGVGYAFRNDALRLKMGGRLKYLQGFANASTPENMKATITTDEENYAIDVNLENVMLRSSGMNILDGSTGNLGSHLINNNNRGVALDLGFTWDMTKFGSIALSVVDLGFISWKDDIENRSLPDTSFFYDGINLVGVRELEDEIKDSLINKFDIDKSYQEYSSLLGPKAYFSYVHHLKPGTDIISTVGVRYVQTQTKVMLGLGYRKKLGEWFTGTVNITRVPQQFFNLGAALAVTGGPVQFYLAADQVAYWDMTKFKSFDMRVGINFLFNGKTKNINDKNSGSTPYFDKLVNKRSKGKGLPGGQSFLGNRKEVKAVDGIYNIIKRQKPRSLEEINKRPKGGEKGSLVPKKDNAPKGESSIKE